MIKKSSLFALFGLLPVLYCSASADASESALAHQEITRGISFLHNVQERDGSWSHYPGITALALSALLRNGHTERNDSSVARGIQFLLRMEKPNGAIYDNRDPNLALPNYNTSLCIMALSLTRNALYRPIILKGQRYLENEQFGASDGMKISNPLYGGIGYGSDPDDHPDLSNLSTALEALKVTGAPDEAKVWKRAIVFIQRVQNRKESNDQAWVKSGPNDGGFVYDPLGDSKSTLGARHSYGSMTYLGLESYIFCGVTKSDPRAEAAWRWIHSHYSVGSNPGMGSAALYYYYNAMAKTLAVYGNKIVKDAQGRKHDWAKDLIVQLEHSQHPDGSWFNSNARFWENQPALVTAYTLITLSYCQKG